MTFTIEQAVWMDQQMRILEETIKKETGRDVIVSINHATMSLELLTDDIVKHVSEMLHIPVVFILSGSRRTPHAFARYVCLFLIRKHYGKKNPDTLAKLFNRDRTTILHAYETLDDLIATENARFMEMLQAADSTFKIETNEINDQD